jgi:hypothetical protein
MTVVVEMKVNYIVSDLEIWKSYLNNELNMINQRSKAIFMEDFLHPHIRIFNSDLNTYLSSQD